MLILIRGPLGVGKSTIAKKLAERLNGLYISIDTILEENGLDEAEGEGIPLKSFLEANRLAFSTIQEAIKQGKPAIVDGNFYHQEQVEDLLARVDCPNHVFTLKASVETCIARDRDRAHSYGEGAAIAVHMMVSRFDYGKVIETDNKTTDEVLDKIIATI